MFLKINKKSMPKYQIQQDKIADSLGLAEHLNNIKA
jgi:hypothetical protein